MIAGTVRPRYSEANGLDEGLWRMDTVRTWTGEETTALRGALRMSVRDFAAHLGVAIRTVSKWEARGRSIVLQPASQAVLDVVLNRSSADESARFRQLVGTEENTPPPVDRLQTSDVLLPLIVDGRTVLTPVSVDNASGRALLDLRAIAADASAAGTGHGPVSDVVEEGEMEIARRRALGALAYGLGAATRWSTSGRRHDARERRHVKAEVMERIQGAVFSYQHVVNAPAAELRTGLGATVIQAHQRYQAANYAAVAEMLPALINGADRVADGSPTAQGVRSSAYIVAAKLLTKIGEAELAWVCADRASTAAMIADSVPARSAGAYQLVCALLAGGQSLTAEQLALQAVEQLATSQMILRRPDLLSHAGALWLISAVIAARHGNQVGADRRLVEADDLAARLGRDANLGWTAFGPTNVAIHRMSAAGDFEDPMTVLRLRASIDTDALPGGLRGRRGEVHVRMAWAHTQLRNDEEAVSHVLAVERNAPELLGVNGVSMGVVQDLLRRERRVRTPELRGIAQRIGVV